MKLLFISGRESTYTRNAVILKGLRDNGVKIIKCTDLSRSYLSRYPTVLGKFMFKRKMDFDLVFIGFFGQPLVPVVKKLTNKPIIFDAYLSAYDTMCFDRKKFKPNSIGGRFFYWLDKHSCELTDKVLLDTSEHVNYFVSTFDLHKERLQKIFVGAEDSLFYPRVVRKHNRKFKVFYHGTFNPLQGIEHIINAAKKLESCKDIEFEIVGKGSEHRKVIKLAQESGVRNIEFVDWISYNRLPSKIAEADVCLGGHFSDIDKAKRVISGKAFQYIAMKKALIVSNTPANRELFENRKNALLIKVASADTLADAILELKDDNSLREKIAEEGHKTFKERCTPRLIGREIKNIAAELLSKGK